MENLAAIAAFKFGETEKEFTLAAGRAATELDPLNTTFWGNLGIYSYRFGDYRGSFASFERAVAVNRGYQPDPSIRRVWAMAAYRAFGEGAAISAERVLELLGSVKDVEGTTFGISRVSINTAIGKMKAAMPIGAAQADSSSSVDGE